MALVKNCLRCGTEFHPFFGRAETQKYCTRRCGEQPRIVLREMSGEQIAWIAGVLDGEGNVTVYTRPRHQNRVLRITITNTCLELVERLKEWTGIGFIAVTTYENPRWRTRYNWIVGGTNARELLKLLTPWLIVKRDIAKQVTDEGPPAHWSENAVVAAEVGRKISQANKGKRRSEEARANMRAARLRYLASRQFT